MGIALPVYEVLQLTSSPVSSGVQDGFDFVLLFTIDDRWGACKGGAVCFRLLIRKEEIDVEDIVDLHRWWKLELICDRSDLFGNGEWSIPFWRELFVSRNGQVTSLEPDLVSFLHLRRFSIVLSVLDVGQQLLGRLPRLFQEFEACFCCRDGRLEVSQDHLRFYSNQKLMGGPSGGVMSPRIVCKLGDGEDLTPTGWLSCCPWAKILF